MFRATAILHNYLHAREGDVMVWWRWWYREWFIVLQRDGSFLRGRCIASRDKRRVGHVFAVHTGTLRNEPEKWPAKVCAAVAAYQLTK
jgi:hypothetical protein